ncbi:DUF2264 domain-containing protein [Zhihengliuella halotolerans]|uniref:DUF2264 domain-containing protein n=1 Tax=Zhihengliuella halotolerans TaxID=370736 RepID=A0A4Q8AE40_9MICC|nr:DUF2264 domain-containing protein [Zhihengliuella halotolerans]RZU62537.1 hypothetical protein EV380_2134 [Zhihengliuella halotolerans]
MPGPITLPPPDLVLSPYTGWTREHHTAVADATLLGVRAWADESHARITPPGPAGGYGRAVDGLEGFARTFLLAGFRLAGEDGRDPLGLAEWYAQGLRAGADPHHPGRWVRLDEHDQAKVEAAAVALILDMTRPWLWDRLDDGTRQRLVDWLAPMVGTWRPRNNWAWFRIVVNQFLKSVGADYSEADIAEDLALLDTFTRADGWFSDGDERNYDHYAGWALHLYPQLWHRMGGHAPGDHSERRRSDRDRLGRYLQDAVRLVGADGSPLVQGRSLVYRFAAAGPFWAGAIAGDDDGTPALAPGLIRRAASGIVRHFAERAAPGADGLLSLGWHGSWPGLAQSYSGPGSPYWASKGLLGLALPADHPVWTAVEEPLPVESGDHAFTIAAPGWAVSATAADGVVRLANHGTDHDLPRVDAAADEDDTTAADAPLYARLGYSTATAPVLGGAGAIEPADQSAALVDAQGRASHRAGFETLWTRTEDGAVSAASRGGQRWVAAERPDRDHGSGWRGRSDPAGTLTVVSVLRGPWELRFVRLEGRAAARATALRCAGWAVAEPGGPAAVVVPLAGAARAASTRREGASPLAETVRVDRVDFDAPVPGRWYAVAVGLGAGIGDPPEVAVAARSARIDWPDGCSTPVDLPA